MEPAVAIAEPEEIVAEPEEIVAEPQPQETGTQEAYREPGRARGVGTTCHQCRQKIRGPSACCRLLKSMKKGGTKLCQIKFCVKCLSNRYNQSVEEVSQDETWTCPKCRGICNCSLCRKKKGLAPTGILAYTAKSSGCASVHDLLEKGDEVVAALQKSSKKVLKNPKRALVTDAASSEPLGSGDENVCIDFNADSSGPTKKKLKSNENVKESVPPMEVEIVLPRGTPVTTVLGAELKPEDVGPALQFIEFCRTFAEIFQVRKGQAERILHDIAGGQGLSVVSSLVAEFHITLLSIIQEDRGMKPVTYSRDGDTWIVDVAKCISASSFVPKELRLDYLSWGVLGYEKLSFSCKLCVLNFLCDESLSTDMFRNFLSPGKKKVPRKEFSANKKDKEPEEATKNMMDGVAVSKDEITVTNEENENAISEIKEGNEEKKNGSFRRIKPVMVHKGAVCWKLDGYCNNASMMLQEVDTDHLMGNKDKWFVYNKDEEKIVEGYVHTKRESQTEKHACT